jgi:uracil-DNA glycosylase
MIALNSLINDVRTCALCAEYLPLGPRPVIQVHESARILVAGQAPGKRVHETGIPFNDPSGDRLRKWMGISYKSFYDPTQVAILPMGFCFPGTGKSGDLPPRRECTVAWRATLLSHLQNLKLTLVLGQYAQTYHLPRENKNKRRRVPLTESVRAWRENWPRIVPLPHPSPRNNLWLKRNPWFEKELIPVLRARVSEILGCDG